MNKKYFQFFHNKFLNIKNFIKNILAQPVMYITIFWLKSYFWGSYFSIVAF